MFIKEFIKFFYVIKHSKFKIFSLLNANTDNANLKEENAILRRNIAEYQKELDQLELLQVSQVK